MEQFCIQCDHVTLSYENQAVVSDLSFTVEEGDYLCIIGENGTGKSTLMKGLLGLKKPSSGSIVLGEGILRSQIGYVPQQTPVQRDFPASVWEVVLSGTQNSRGWRPGYGKREKELAVKSWSFWAFRSCGRRASGICPGDSGRGCCWPVPCVRQKS